MENSGLIDPKDLIDAKGAATLKGCAASLFAYYKKTGRCPNSIVICGHEFYSKKEILAWEPARFNPGPKHQQ